MRSRVRTRSIVRVAVRRRSLAGCGKRERTGVRERMDERRHKAAGRSRVARDSIDVAAVQAQEAEQQAMAEDALRRFEGAAIG